MTTPSWEKWKAEKLALCTNGGEGHYDCVSLRGRCDQLTYVEEAYQKGREDAVDCIVNLKITPEGQDTKTTAELITIAWEIIKPSLLENIEARHAGEVTKPT